MIIEGMEGQINLKKLFNECNEEYFSGMVPTCKLEWSGRIKRAVGRAIVKYNGKVHKNKFTKFMKEIPQADVNIIPKSLKIQMSKSFDMEEDDIKAIMLHEMVHILLFSKKKLGGHHGTPEFDGWIKKLRKLSGLNVPLLESHFKSSPKLQEKEGLLLIVELSNGEYAYTTYSSNFMNKNWMKFAEVIGKFISNSPKYIKADMYRVSHKAVSSTSPKRSLKSFSANSISYQEVKEIEKKGKLFYHADNTGSWINIQKAGLIDNSIKGTLNFDSLGKPINFREVKN